jgi:hypothetical protein
VIEEWKETPSFPGYEASSLGRARSIKTRKSGEVVKQVLVARDNGRGYPLVHMWVGDKRTGRCVHRLVADAFVGSVEGREVNHIDGDKWNNMPENLEFMTRGENIRHAYALGLRKRKRGADGPTAKLTVAQVREIRAMKGSLRYEDIGNLYGVGQSTISSIMNRQSWREVA